MFTTVAQIWKAKSAVWMIFNKKIKIFNFFLGQEKYHSGKYVLLNLYFTCPPEMGKWSGDKNLWSTLVVRILGPIRRGGAARWGGLTYLWEMKWKRARNCLKSCISWNSKNNYIFVISLLINSLHIYAIKNIYAFKQWFLRTLISKRDWRPRT